jgi:hypothetical protein
MTTQFLQCLIPGFNLLRLEHEEIDTDNHHLNVNVLAAPELPEIAATNSSEDPKILDI